MVKGLRDPQEQTLFEHGPPIGVRALILIVLALVLLVLDHREGHLDRARDALTALTYPIQLIVDLPVRTTERARESLTGHTELLEELRELRSEQLENRAKLQRLESLEAENRRLRELLDSAERVGERFLAAELLRVELDPFHHRVVLNRGSRDGVYQGQPLLDADGVMGQVTRIGPFGAEAVLLTDPGSATPVELVRNGLRTIAIGSGDLTRLELPYLPNSADIEEGDLLVTSGLGMRYPRGYPVARVTEVERRPGETFARIEARPTAALNRSREVLLVWREDGQPFDRDPLQEHPPGSEEEGPGEQGAEDESANGGGAP